MVKNPFDAQDLTQETFLSAYKKLPEFDGTYEKAWISRIATNKCLDYHKKCARRSEPKEDIYFEEIKDQRAGPEEIYIDQEAKQFVLKICGQIKPPYDKIAREHFYEEKISKGNRRGVRKELKNGSDTDLSGKGTDQKTDGRRKQQMTEEHTHISDEMWKKYAQGTLSTKEEEKLYTHVGCCTYCAERFANIVETDFFAEPPSYLYDEIVERSRKVDVQAAATVRKTSKKMKLLFYSLKVGFAVAASIFLLTMTTTLEQNPRNFRRFSSRKISLRHKKNK